MKRAIALAVLCAGLLPAQEKPKPQEEPQVSRIFQLKHVDPQKIANVLSVFGVHQQWNSELKILAVRAPEPVTRAVEEAIKRLDVPPPPTQNIDLTLYILAASDAAGGTVPTELDGVVKQLRATFGFKGFRLIDTQIYRTRPGEGFYANSIAEPGSSGRHTWAQFRFQSSSISTDERGRLIRLNRLSFGLKIPVQTEGDKWQYLDTGLDTEVDVREGQKVVVGKATSLGGPDRASFLVVMARVVE